MKLEYNFLKRTSTILLIGILLTGCSESTKDIFYHPEVVSQLNFDENYKLVKSLILSRHNIRSPLSNAGSLLSEITPYQWFNWSSDPGELSTRGGLLEANMGQFFRKYYAKKDFFDENYIPDEGEIRIFSNSLQRTISTASFFSQGLFPVANIKTEYIEPYNSVIPMFCPTLKNLDITTKNTILDEIYSLGGDDGLLGIGKSLEHSFRLLENLIDFKDSDYAKEHNITQIPTDDFTVSINEGEEVKIGGGIKIANSIVGALKLQIYEEKDINKALFNHKLSEDEIKCITLIGDTYLRMNCGTYTLATNLMHDLIYEIKNEFENLDRKFTFLCGHDSNIMSLASALEIKTYNLPSSISVETPIGGKLVFEKYIGKDNIEYIKPYMVYNTTYQLRSLEIASIENPAMFYELEFNNMNKNNDGYYKYDDFMNRIEKAYNHY